MGGPSKSRRGRGPSSGRGGPTYRFERAALAKGARRIAGIDEAGRGPLAGPVVAAAVALPDEESIPGLNDSKLLSENAREDLFHRITEHAVAIGLEVVSPEVIDRINILQATRLAMKQAALKIDPPPDYLIIDGPITLDLDIAQEPVIKGDRLCFSVAAAGIVAKVSRDRLMMELHERYPDYGFASHKGYGTRVHKEAIARCGPSPAHRKTFKGVKEHVLPALFE